MQERNLISKLQQQFSGSCDYLLQGIGDDCAVFAETDSMCWLVSTDLLVEDIHFIIDWQPGNMLGRKAIAVNLSDIAAMGGDPRFVLLSLVVPEKISDQWLRSFHEGVQGILKEFSCNLIGGDISSGNRFTVSVTIIGSGHPGHIIYRSGAIPNQDIYVTGHLGSSAAGLDILKRGGQNLTQYTQLIEAHLNPVPQVKIAQSLARSGRVAAMQDISDGIATDLGHICKASGVSAEIDRDTIPITPLVTEMAKKYNLPAIDLALYGGEDYQLVFVSARENREYIQSLADETGTLISRVGTTCTGPPQVFLVGPESKTEISFRGFEHN